MFGRTALIAGSIAAGAYAPGPLEVSAFEPPRIDFEDERLSTVWSAAGDVSASREALPVAVAADDELPDRPYGSGVRLSSADGGGMIYTREGALASDWSAYERISLWIWRSAERAEAGATTIELQMIEPGGGRFWRKLALDHAGWERVELPLSTFGWQQTRIPRWDRIRHLGVFLRDGDELVIDEVRVHDDADGPGPFLTAHEVRTLAFEERARSEAVRTLDAQGIELVTDAPELDLERVHARLVEAAAYVDALLPEGGDTLRVPRLVVFEHDADYRAFAPRLAEAYARAADRPSSGGYTLLAIAHGAWSDDWKSDRPTYVHEFVHSFLSCRALLPNKTEWLQEGLANHVQQVFHRQAGLEALVTDGAASVEDTAPLERVTSGEPITGRDYWLAMTLTETLMRRERYADGFAQVIATARTNGTTALGPILDEVYGSDYAELLTEWRAHCAEAYAVDETGEGSDEETDPPPVGDDPR